MLMAGMGSDEPLSLRAIARAAGVAPTAVYLHFDDRDELVLAVLERLFGELAAIRDNAERQAAEDGGGDWERLRARSRAYVAWGVANPGAYHVLYEGRAVLRLTDPRGLTFGQSMLDRTTELVGRLTAAERIRPAHLSDRISLLLWVALHGIVSLKINKDTIEWPPPSELADQALEAITCPVHAAQ